jgi:hypothetical protein
MPFLRVWKLHGYCRDVVGALQGDDAKCHMSDDHRSAKNVITVLSPVGAFLIFPLRFLMWLLQLVHVQPSRHVLRLLCSTVLPKITAISIVCYFAVLYADVLYIKYNLCNACECDDISVPDGKRCGCENWADSSCAPCREPSAQLSLAKWSAGLCFMGCCLSFLSAMQIPRKLQTHAYAQGGGNTNDSGGAGGERGRARDETDFSKPC